MNKYRARDKYYSIYCGASIFFAKWNRWKKKGSRHKRATSPGLNWKKNEWKEICVIILLSGVVFCLSRKLIFQERCDAKMYMCTELVCSYVRSMSVNFICNMQTILRRECIEHRRFVWGLKAVASPFKISCALTFHCWTEMFSPSLWWICITRIFSAALVC